MNPTALVADDNILARKLVGNILKQEDFTVCAEAADGNEAVTLALRLKPDLIILDIMMPELNGLAATAQILKMAPGIAIILYTFHNDPQVELQGLKVGARRVISKSDARMLVNAIREFQYQRSLGTPENPPDRGHDA